MQRFSPSKSIYVGRFAALTAGLLVGAVLSSLSSFADPFASFGTVASGGSRPTAPVYATDEVSPDELARELGLPLEANDPFSATSGFTKKLSSTRVVPPSRFKNYRVNVDIFRKSTKRPVLGAYRDEYAATLVPNSAGMSEEEISREAQKRFARLAAKEFAVLSVDGRPERAYIISGGLERRITEVVKDGSGNPVLDEAGNPIYRQSLKTTPPGNYRLDAYPADRWVDRADGTRAKETIANPWLKSSKYGASPMYWGLWIMGGYFIHSTTHYGELGRPASMGCIRQSFPDAQALFKLLVEDDLEGMIRIHTLGSSKALSRLRELVVDLAYEAPENAPVLESPADPSLDMNWVIAQLARSESQIDDMIAYYGRELRFSGHSWMDAETGRPAATRWPQCAPAERGPVDCFKPYGRKKPKLSLN